MIEFIEETHQYVLDGVLVPSVSEILHFIFPDKYKGVDKEILNKKAIYGTGLHEAIEMYEINIQIMTLDEAFNTTVFSKKLNYIQEASLRQYIKLKRKNNIHVMDQEQIIHYEDLYAGRFDMIAKIGGKMCLCDIKTTAELDMEYLSWQLSFYELATGKRFDDLYAIWLPKKELGQLVKVQRKSEEDLKQMIKKFMESRG